MSECQIDQETDYTGTDLASIGVGSQQECADLCASTKNGLVWTWIYGYCYIKSSISGKINNPNAVSGNYKCGSGGNLSRVYLNAKNIIYDHPLCPLSSIFIYFCPSLSLIVSPSLFCHFQISLTAPLLGALLKAESASSLSITKVNGFKGIGNV